MTYGIHATIDARSQIAELSMAKGRDRQPLNVSVHNEGLPNLNFAKAQSLRDEHR